MNAKIVGLAIVGVLACRTIPVRAQNADQWVGKRVITKYGTVLRVGSRIVDDQRKRTSPKTGKERSEFRVYRVVQRSGSWLWLVHENGGARGWVSADSVIPLASAIDYFTAQIRENPSNVGAKIARGAAWFEMKEYDAAIADCTEAIVSDPAESAAYIWRGNAWNKKKQYDKAITDYAQAIDLDPSYAMTLQNRASAWYAKNEFASAVNDCTEAIRIDPQFAWAYDLRGHAERARGEYDRALADYAAAIRADANDPWAYARRAWIWATCPRDDLRDGKQAVDSARRAIELAGSAPDAFFYDALAAAQAETGDFDAAVQSATKAVERMSKDDPDHEAIPSRLEKYKAKKPYRDEPSRSR